MALYNIIKSFYGSSKWQILRVNLIAERGPICERCGKLISNALDLIGHHKIELTPENIFDVNISLNPDNIKLICKDCHDKEHHRFAYQNKHEVYIVYGAPLSGKTTYVKQNMQRGDLVIDMDLLYGAISLLPTYDKPNGLLSNVRGIHDLLIDNIKTRYGKWGNAWVIGGYADKYKREQLADSIGAELVFCDISKAECMARLELDEGRRYRKDEWQRYIDVWFERYVV